MIIYSVIVVSQNQMSLWLLLVCLSFLICQQNYSSHLLLRPDRLEFEPNMPPRDWNNSIQLEGNVGITLMIFSSNFRR